MFDHWRRVEALYHAALSREPGDRATYLAEACEGDEVLQREVESLLRHLGAEVQSTHGARLTVKLNKVVGQLHRPHHSGSLSKHDVRHLREFLARAGVTLSAYAERRSS